MRVLVLANTPAHVHLYRNAVTALRDRGNEVLILGRDAGCVVSLLEYYGLPHRIYGRHRPHDAPLSFVGGIVSQGRTIASVTRRFGPDVVLGRGPYAAFAGTVGRAPVVLVLDDEPTDVNHSVSRPFATCIISPAATRRDLGPKHLTFEGLTECAYLHPAVSERDGTVRERLGLGADERFSLVRFNAHEALHDGDISGFTGRQRRGLLTGLAAESRVFVSDERGSGPVEGPGEPLELHPARVHDAMAEAAVFVSDTGTMAVEAALLGTPSLRYRGSDKRQYGEFDALERAGLLEQFDAYEAVRDRGVALLSDPAARRRWRRRRDAVVPGLANVTEIIVAAAEERGDPDRVAGRAGLTRRRSDASAGPVPAGPK